MRTYTITIEYTTMNDTPLGNPEGWDWHTLLELSPEREAVTVMVEDANLDTEHARLIAEAIAAD